MTLHSTLRLITAEELHSVSGGDIVVNGTPPVDPAIVEQLNRIRFQFDMSMFGGGVDLGGGGAGAVDDSDWDPDGDDDGDGIPNSEEEIVVIAHPTVDLPGDFYARYDGQAGAWLIWEDDIFFDDFMGWFVPGTPDNHNLVTRDSNWGVNVGVTVPTRGVEAGADTSGGDEEYWLRVPPPPTRP